MSSVLVGESTWPASPSAVAELITRHEPVIFRGLAKTWIPDATGGTEAVLAWLKHTAGHRIVPVWISLPSDAGFMGTGGRKAAGPLGGQRTLASAIEECLGQLARPTGHNLYVQSVEVATTLPELLPALRVPRDVQSARQSHWRMWLGSGQHHVNLHYDGYENFYCVLSGEKRFSLCPFAEISNVYIGSLDGNTYGTPSSVVNPKAPDLERYPAFAKVIQAFQTAELKAGDVLYLPSNWWHFVESFGFNCSVNLWWSDVTAREHSLAYQTFFSSLESLRSLPDHWRDYWRGQFAREVFASGASVGNRVASSGDDLMGREAGPGAALRPSSTLRLSRDASFTLGSADDLIWRRHDRPQAVRVGSDMHEALLTFYDARSVEQATNVYRALSPEQPLDGFLYVLNALVGSGVLVEAQHHSA